MSSAHSAAQASIHEIRHKPCHSIPARSEQCLRRVGATCMPFCQRKRRELEATASYCELAFEDLKPQRVRSRPSHKILDVKSLWMCVLTVVTCPLSTVC